jgi:ABC-type anion transport system duplicated permease subunit
MMCFLQSANLHAQEEISTLISDTSQGTAILNLVMPAPKDTGHSNTWAKITVTEQLIPTPGIQNMLSAQATIKDEVFVEIPVATFASKEKVELQPILQKYGKPTLVQSAEDNIGATSKRKIKRHWYGALALISDEAGNVVVGMALKKELLLELASEGDFKRVAQKHVAESK